MSLYTDIVAAGVPHENHESDLYIPYNDITKPLLDAYYKQGGARASGFVHNGNGEAWLDVPFAYDPFWRKAAKREMRIPTNNT